MSNVRLAILVGIALILVVIFGRNPADEIRKQRAERAGKKLVEKIEEANKKNKRMMPMQSRLQFNMGTPNNGNNAGMQSNSQPVRTTPYYQRNNQMAVPGASNIYPRTPPGGANPGYPATDAYMRPGVPGNPYYPATQGAAGPRNAPSPKDDYYPPAPSNQNLKVPLSALTSPSVAALTQRSFKRNPNRVTDDGQDLAFWGTKVYTYDENGNLKPIPDGKYSMYNGKWTMVVRGGEQTIANGDTVGWRH